MEDYLNKLAYCIEKGRLNSQSKIPSNMLGQDGVEELINQLIQLNTPPKIIIEKGLIKGMNEVGNKFRDGKIFIPDVLLSAKAMNYAIELLKKEFPSENMPIKGKVILATVEGDLHSIGKNIVKVILEGNGWKVIDLGVDVSSEKIIVKLKEDEIKAIGLSALLTTTMLNMKKIIIDLRNSGFNLPVAIGGAPVTQKFADEIQADFYSSDPNEFVNFLDKLN
ncbi:MAG: corrinoid protein [Ignavibacterium sp.]|nr:corrinoid protein [Ignavibacterium sp.]MCX7611952.1 corrinoid protein [Ignavibacterium sp.]MDW8374748.1 corrinoid protein [Ignavibacteriales bacterium]